MGLDLGEHATPAYNDDFVDYEEQSDRDLDALFDELTAR